MRTYLSAAAALAAFASSPVLAQEVTVSTGVDYSEGDFGTDVDTSILVVPLTLRTKFDDLTISASIPYIEINGSSSVVGGGEGPIIVDPTLTDTKRSGIGDLSLRARYNLIDFGPAELSIDGRVKLPTGSEAKRLSTGETDFSAGFEVAATQGAVQPFAELGYRVLGDPDGVNLRNGIYGSAGAVVLFPGSVAAIASYDYVEASVDTVDDSHSLFGGLVIPVGRRIDLTTYGTAGLSDSAPDWGVGVLLSFKLATDRTR